MIRRASQQDLPRIVEMGREFYKLTAFSEIGTPYDPDSVTRTLDSLLNSPDAVLFVAENEGGEVVGVVGAALVPLFFNYRVRSVSEFFWYMDPQHRGRREALRLHRALEQWAKEKNAPVMQMAALQNSSQSVRDYYSKAGYHESETAFIKRMIPQ